MSLNNLVKRLQDIMRNDAGINGDAQRIEQMVWILFLKVYDAKEEIWEFYDENYTSIIPEELRWRNWAVDHKDGKALTGDALLDFVNGKLFPTLKAIAIDENTPMSQIIVRTAFEDNNNYMKDGILLRQVINAIDEIDFEEYEDRHAFGEIYETILRSLQSAGNSGEFYTPRAVTDFMVQMIKRCGDSFQIVRHKRSTRLTLEKKPYSLKRDLKKGDALIVFSKKSVLALAAHLENQGVRCSVIYGSLPPATRREQVRRFLERETEVVVSTDAIGMGLNLPIRRIVFVETRKFDGTARRSLLPEEIRQIAGRAGRFGLYDEGFVTAIDDIETIEDGLSARPLPIMKAYVGFPEQLLNLPAEIDTLVKIWAGMEAPAIYEKMEVDELLSLYMSFERIHGDHLEEFTKQEIYKLITCSVDIDNRLVMDLWKDYCREYREVDELEFPYSPGTDLYDMESYYKMLDLYFQFSRKTGLPVQEENLFHERRSTEEEISRILRTECGSYTRKCSICGRELSWDHPFSICERCFERGRSSQKRSRFHDQRYNH